ncbi:hypothetical protein ACFL2T_02345 [Elusimicrobiota bacterium]
MIWEEAKGKIRAHPARRKNKAVAIWEDSIRHPLELIPGIMIFCIGIVILLWTEWRGLRLWLVVVGMVIFDVAFYYFVGDFLRYLRFVRERKRALYRRLAEEPSLEKGLAEDFSELLAENGLCLPDGTIKFVSGKLSNLENKMEFGNALEIYGAFLWIYIFRDGLIMHPTKIDDGKIRFAVNNLKLSEKNGYYVIAPDKSDDTPKKRSI